jgi:hypothetical protein
VSSRIIGITGQARNGKDTAGGLLVSEYGFTRVALADALRSMALAIDPIVSGGNIRLHHEVNGTGWENAKKNPEVRRFLQVLGTEGVRNHIGQDSWIRAAKVTIDQIDGPVVVCDVRFPNEADAIHGWGGELWRVVRINPDGSRYDNGIGTEHASESHVASLTEDLTFMSSSVSQLKSQIRAYMGQGIDLAARLMQLAEGGSP